MARRHERISAGKRDRVIRLEERPETDAVDGEGAPEDGPWTTLVDRMPAAKETLSGRERFAAAQISAPVDTRWEINYRVDMDPELVDVPKLRRVVTKDGANVDRVHDIVHAAEIGRRQGIELFTLAKVG